ncbi:hypothetical protein [Marinobacter sp. F3R08]|uniref:hypothetical protein n=1 Tax=Marinobacter sp. F3R08 TaxID=2841559 RepID=UPI001C07F0A5|nr:hypothetical protein [Marinobacter sp. F3R08]MBU2952299.1 hypothetical protein [Marinobacter sp. F3R08]
MDITFFIVIGLIKAVTTLLLLGTPWVAWRKGFPGRAVALSVIALGYSTLVWWPHQDEPSQIMSHIESQMLWFAVIVVILAPLAYLFHKLEKSDIQ